MAAKEHHRDRPVGEKPCSRPTRRPPSSGSHERRHHVTRAWRVFTSAILVDARHQPVDRRTIGRKDLAPSRRIGLELLPQCTVHVAAVQKGKPEAFGVSG